MTGITEGVLRDDPSQPSHAHAFFRRTRIRSPCMRLLMPHTADAAGHRMLGARPFGTPIVLVLGSLPADKPRRWSPVGHAACASVRRCFANAPRLRLGAHGNAYALEAELQAEADEVRELLTELVAH